MTVSNINTTFLTATTSSKVSEPVETPPFGGKIGFAAVEKTADGKIGFTPPSDGKIGRNVDVTA